MAKPWGTGHRVQLMEDKATGEGVEVPGLGLGGLSPWTSLMVEGRRHSVDEGSTGLRSRALG